MSDSPSADILSLAARARSIVDSSEHVEIGSADGLRLLVSHLVTPEGDLLASAQGMTGRCARHLGEERLRLVEAHAIDVSGVPQRDRLRGTVQLTGHIAPVPPDRYPEAAARLELSPEESLAVFVAERVRLQPHYPAGDETGVIDIPLTEYRRAAADPLTGWERVWLAHLDHHHNALLRAMAAWITPLSPEDEVHPLLADRDGITLRIYRPGIVFDLPVPFPEPVHCGCGAMSAFGVLAATVWS